MKQTRHAQIQVNQVVMHVFCAMGGFYPVTLHVQHFRLMSFLRWLDPSRQSLYTRDPTFAFLPTGGSTRDRRTCARR
ncbi:hypothetical protein PsorP6_007505 [Peronosclerospora sorghi]|uniref:Uncharacterized protein n=1 Tax=Peronosclerospora sorghi TaxID=230839 RepID=A0ACC0WBQ3_9STRA|nr:hypothetical protein PsorP6_007505 [Peronosclerospora sorghi]